MKYQLEELKFRVETSDQDFFKFRVNLEQNQNTYLLNLALKEYCLLKQLNQLIRTLQNAESLNTGEIHITGSNNLTIEITNCIARLTYDLGEKENEIEDTLNKWIMFFNNFRDWLIKLNLE